MSGHIQMFFYLQFLKALVEEETSRAATILVNPSSGKENLPITWASTTSSLTRLMKKSTQGKECVQFCFEVSWDGGGYSTQSLGHLPRLLLGLWRNLAMDKNVYSFVMR